MSKTVLIGDVLFQFISGSGLEEEDVTLMPVKLPLELKQDPDLKREGKLKIKDEPMDTSDDKDGETNDIVAGKANLFRQSSTDSVKCGDLFGSFKSGL